jgi:OOP family OmpA-OmpF porin
MCPNHFPNSGFTPITTVTKTSLVAKYYADIIISVLIHFAETCLITDLMRKKMTKSKRSIFIAFALLTFFGSAQAQQKTVDNWNTGAGTSLRGGADSTLCWRDANWTPATASPECDGAIKPAAPAAAAPRAAAPVAPVATSSKVTLLSDALFDFDKSTLKPEGIMKLNDLVKKLKDVTVEVIIVVGFTDSVGTLAYNKKLSLRRAEAVKAHLTKNGIEASRVYTEGKAFAEPVGDNKTAVGRALNRRSVIEVVGTRKK